MVWPLGHLERLERPVAAYGRELFGGAGLLWLDKLTSLAELQLDLDAVVAARFQPMLLDAPFVICATPATDARWLADPRAVARLTGVVATQSVRLIANPVPGDCWWGGSRCCNGVGARGSRWIW